ncbi:Acetylcholinesterase-1 [Araneus ventricosus]|nr:Acetylcholinesterase-1 [Araneus ventricosus]
MGQSTDAFRILFISCIALYFFEKVNCDSVVRIGRSQIVGQSVYSGEGVVSQYLAIPYAEPPIGPLRFKKPVPRKFLPDLYFAFNNPPACWQKSAYQFPWYDALPPKDEDCLYLNIWAPENASPTNKKAVIYFLYGGGFRFGSIKQRVYNGAPLAAHGDVIVVTANYRLGTFGFLTSGTEDAPGNVEVSPEVLTDVSAAMQPLSSVLYIPQFGDELLPMDPQKALQNDNFTCTDLLIGNTHDEGSYQLTTHNPAVYGFFGALNPAINKTLGKSEIIRMLYEFPHRDAVAEHYLPESLPDDAHDTIRKQVYASLGDASIVCPATFYAERCAKTGGNVYKYVWNHRPTTSVWFPWMGAVHATELEFVFGTPLLHSFHYKPDEVDLSRTIINIWSSFAKNGLKNEEFNHREVEKELVNEAGRIQLKQKDLNLDYTENAYTVGSFRQQETRKKSFERSGAVLDPSRNPGQYRKISYPKGMGSFCDFCSRKGHDAYKCYKKRNKEKKQAFASETSFCGTNQAFGVSKDWDQFLIDTAATSHFCYDRDWFKNFKELTTTKALLDDKKSTCEVKGIGDIDFIVKDIKGNVKLTLKDVFYTPNMRRNLISGARMDIAGLKITWSNNVMRICHSNNEYFFSAFLQDMLYIVSIYPLLDSVMYTSLDLNLIHTRLCHVNIPIIKDMCKNKSVKGLEKVNIKIDNESCIACVM